MDLFDFAGKHLRFIRKLTDDEAQAWRTDVNHLSDFRQARKLILMMKHNQLELAAELDSAVAILEKASTLTEARDQIDLHANRRFLNYLTTMRLFLDHTETRLKRTYGAESEPCNTFRERTKTSFDTSFGYRFLYKLRNYGQHCGLPLGNVGVQSRLTQPRDGEVVKTVTLSIDTKKLLATGTDVWGPVAEDLKSGPANLDVLPLVVEASWELVAIEHAVVETEKAALATVANRLIATVESVVDDGGVPVVGTVTPKPGGGDIDLVLPPPDIMRWLGMPALAVSI